MKNELKKKVREALLEKDKEKDNDLISHEQKQLDSERDIVEKSEDKSILPEEDKN